MHHLGMHFGISVASVHRIIHNIVPLMHVDLVKKFIKWPTANEWRSMARYYRHWPTVVGIIDGTPFCISKPMGEDLLIIICNQIINHTAQCRKIIPRCKKDVMTVVSIPPAAVVIWDQSVWPSS